ncbi:MAG: restriction endonuclease, partial [Odoribacteraceae bacterium]|nr:restriction endonuclease [Odoribacteraceae bacterium]
EQTLERTRNIRWESIFGLFSIDCTKAGFLVKNKGIWFLTNEGKKAMELGEEHLLKAAREGYKKWQNNIDNEIADENTQEIRIEALEEQAIYGIREFIKRKNAYEFQNIVAALLRAMGYYTPFISPKGKDGGVDIIAYTDPLGAIVPRLKVQVKHTPDDAVNVETIRGLTGLLNKDGDIGLVVTSGRFTSESERTARESHRHVKLLNGDDLIELWRKFYAKMPDEDKNLVPLHSISFLGYQ